MITVMLYSRKDCHLCDQAKADLEALQESIPHELIVKDIDDDPKTKKAYGDKIPVVEVGPYRLKAPFDRTELQITLGAVREGIRQDAAIAAAVPGENRPLTWSGADRVTYWLSKHYLALFNILVLIYVGLPFLAPVLMRAGAPGPAAVIYRVYGTLCHQLAYRSWFLFGEQNAYPQTAAGVDGLVPFETATGIEPENVWIARQFLGNDELGYKVALCERDVAIYGGILLFGVVFALTGRKLRPFPWYFWILLGLVPIGLDGVSQLVSQLPLGLVAYRESTPFLRTLTGGLFGVTTAWFGYPMVEETMVETKKFLQAKLLRLKGTPE